MSLALRVLMISLLLLPALMTRAEALYGSAASGTSREYGGFSEQPPGAVVTIDPAALGTSDDLAGFSMNPGGTTLLVDAFDPPSGPPEDGWLLGLAWTNDLLYAASAECAGDFCAARPSRLIEVDPASATAVEVGPILEAGEPQSIEDLATDPVTGVLYGISSLLDFDDPSRGCTNCLFTIDPLTGAATRMGVVTVTMFREPLGLAFAPDGTLYATTFPDLATRTARLLTLDPATATTLAQEDVLLEQQHIQRSGGQDFLITSVTLYGLAVDGSGRLVGSSANGVTQLYERIRGVVKNTNGDPVTGEETWVWRVIGDSGEDISDVVFEPASEVDDSDGDGVPDDQDACPGGDDGLDRDADSTPDFCDACPDDPDDDADGDGVCGDTDVCPGEDDTADADGDGVPDACDVCPVDPDNDADGDGSCADVDSCPGGDDRIDADGDGTPDFCDVCPADGENDADGDGVCESEDNCPLVANSNQSDMDMDGVGDACEADADDDGVDDGIDNCPFDFNPLQEDFDGDGAGDICDTDLDSDGVADDADACVPTPSGEVVRTDGCSIPELAPCDHPMGGDRWKNHGAYVSTVAHVSQDFVNAGLITEDERDAIVSEAAESSCGKKQK